MDKIKKESRILKEIEENFEKEKGEIEKQKKEFISDKKVQILLKYENKLPKNREELRELCSILCFGSLNWCCGVKGNPYGGFKNCFSRDLCLQVLGIDDEEFLRIKDCVEKEIERKIKVG